MKKINYKRKTALVLNELIKNRGLDIYLGKLNESKIGVKVILTISVVIGAASLFFILTKLAVLLISAPYVVYITIVTITFCLYLMIKIENQGDIVDAEEMLEENDDEIIKDEDEKK